MSKPLTILLLFFLAVRVSAQEDKSQTFRFKGQAIGYTHFNPSNEQKLWLGARYLPQLNSEIHLKHEHLIDFEASANIYGNLALSDFSSSMTDGDLKPYRLWARYSAPQLEIRAGLQKINFGSASVLRPLKWFDQIVQCDSLKF